jgi:hypothetical protein
MNKPSYERKASPVSPDWFQKETENEVAISILLY